MRPYLPFLIAAPVAIGALVLLAPFADDALLALRPARAASAAPIKPKSAETPAPASLARPSASALQGPWRCTDQRTGLAAYWTFGADGTLTFYGDTFKEGAARPVDPAVPNGWQLTDDRLVLTFAQKLPVSYKVSDLSLSRLHYSDGRDLDIQCRRP